MKIEDAYSARSVRAELFQAFLYLPDKTNETRPIERASCGFLTQYRKKIDVRIQKERKY